MLYYLVLGASCSCVIVPRYVINICIAYMLLLLLLLLLLLFVEGN